VVLEGETLSSIAGLVYSDPARWRPIAIANRVERPQALAVGSRLIVPQLPFRDPENGEVVI
jgi:nucleoid-associated protein YgaU